MAEIKSKTIKAWKIGKNHFSDKGRGESEEGLLFILEKKKVGALKELRG